MQLQDQDVVRFLHGNSVRDGYLLGLSIREGKVEKWEHVVTLTFNVPRGTEGEGNHYTLELSGIVKYDYNFNSDYTPQQIPMVKCLWTDDGLFYLSLDPWKESEAFVSDQDNDCFLSKSAKLTVEHSDPMA
jgi:hypothetical protein